MGERDPRVDPQRGDVFRWTYDDGQTVATCVAHGGDVYTRTFLGDDGDDVETDVMPPSEWDDWSEVDGGIDGVQVLYRAGVSDG